jgi:hypothetical protein
MADTLLFILYYYKTYMAFDALGTQCEMARSRAHENLHKLSSMLDNILVSLDLMHSRELVTPEKRR